MIRISILFLLFVGSILSARTAFSQTVVHHPDPGQDLQSRWNWGIAEAKSRNFSDGYWLACAIERRMEADAYIGHIRLPRDGDEVTLEKIIFGTSTLSDAGRSGESLQEAAQSALDRIRRTDAADEIILKPVAILFHTENGAGRPGRIKQVRVSNLSLQFDLHDRPLIWLGGAEQEESLALLSELYDDTDYGNVRERLVMAIGIHQLPERVIPLLADIAGGEHDEGLQLRREAVFWIGRQEHPDGLRILRRLVLAENSPDLREHAVFSISQMEIPAAQTALIELARQAPFREVRRKAIFWVGQLAGETAEETLTAVAYSDDEAEIQEQAVFAISQLPADESIPRLIDIAENHPHSEVRRKAIFWLGQSEDQRAVDALIRFLEKH